MASDTSPLKLMVRLSANERGKLKELAAKNRRSMNAEIGIAVDEYLRKATPNFPELKSTEAAHGE